MRYTLILLTLFLMFTASAQKSTNSKERIKVFLDCSNTWCDETYIRTEINTVDYIIDRVSADVHILLTTQNIGSGGEQFQLIFYGLNEYQKEPDTLRFETLPLATDVEERESLVHYLKAGLIPFIAKAGYLHEVTLLTKQQAHSDKKGKAGNAATKDKWNYWVFRTRINGNFNSDQNYRSRDLGSRISADRITDKQKLSFSLNANDNRNIFIINNKKIQVRNHSINFSHLFAKSINEHWTYGYELNGSQATFVNIKKSISFNPSIEYNVFPYANVNTKLLTIRYGPDIRSNQYYDTTIYGKTNEILGGHNLLVNLSLNQKWGTISTGMNYRNFFHNWRLYNLSFNTYVDVRLTGNLSFNIYAVPSIVRDQVFLPKGDATADDILSRRRQLQTNYNFYMGFGVTYRFGSVLNNFVNPRFNNGGGGMFFF